ncbi:hypothetical protein ASF53_19585 [Methylobacterium sp. Leaf123]|nr:hypothetical protein ASF53_19585 [Methylobacterium sp. Leaf123]
MFGIQRVRHLDYFRNSPSEIDVPSGFAFATQQLLGGLLVRVLLHKFAAYGEVEDGLTQGLDLVRPLSEGRQRIEGEVSIILECFGIGCVEAGKARRRQPVAHSLAVRPRRLQPVAQAH